MINLNSLGGINGEKADPQRPQSDLGQQDFLRLMVTQLQNQDPFKPMDNGEFLTQIAQFTTANGISELQNSFQNFAKDMSTDQALRAASLVGREVLVESNTGYLPEGGNLTGVVKAPQDLENLTIRVYSQAGELLREIPMGRQPGGDVAFQWDGMDKNGRSLPPGRYLIGAQTEIQGQPMALATLMSAEVTSVQLGRGGQSPMLSLQGIGELSLAAVRQIK
jgi:flagellar basal-body rod modification protein FlgD